MKKNLVILALIALIAGNVNAVAKRLIPGSEEALFMNPQEEPEFSSEEGLFQHEGYPIGSGSAARPIQIKPIEKIKPIEPTVYTLKIVRKDVPSAGVSQEIELTNEEGKPLQGDILELKRYIAQHKNEYFGIPIEEQKLLFNGNELKNEGLLSTFPSGATLYLEVKEKKSEGLQEAAPTVVERKEAAAIKEESKQMSQKKSALKKPISTMTSREIGQLKYDDLSEEDQTEIFKIATLSGLEAHRNAARKVFEKSGKKIDWAKRMANMKNDAREEFMKLMTLASDVKAEESVKKSSAKLLDKMSSQEIGALKYENLSPAQQEQLFEMALFSGLESNRSAARKVIDIYRASKKMEKLQWDKQLADILAG